MPTTKTDILPKCSGEYSLYTNFYLCQILVSVPTVIKWFSGGTYGLRMGSTSSPSYYMDDLTDCPNSSVSSCPEIWGINTSVSRRFGYFPRIQTSSDMSL